MWEASCCSVNPVAYALLQPTPTFVASETATVAPVRILPDFMLQ